MKKKPIVSHHEILLFLFLLGSFLFVHLNFRYWYSFLEQYMMFQTTGSYFQERLVEPGGLNEYVTEFLSLSFAHPFGAASVIALLFGITAACFGGFLRKCQAVASMWIAVLPLFLFWLYPQESIALLVMVAWALVCARLYVQVDHAGFRFVLGACLTTLSYFIATPAHILLAVLMLIYELSVSETKGGKVFAGLNLFWALLVPLVAMRTLYILPMREAFLSKHLSHPEYPIPTVLWWVLLAFPVISLFAIGLKNKTFFRNETGKIMAPYASQILMMGLCIYWIKNPMEQAYRYDLYAQRGEWQKIITHAQTHPVHDKDALVYLNLALSKQGSFTENLLHYPQIGEEGFIPHDPKSRLGLIQASEVAWQVGQVNAAQRFAFVGVLSSQRCVQPRLMKRLVETYLVTGEYGAAAKYIKILESTPHYKDWAKAQRPLLDSAVCASTDWVKAKRHQLPITDNPFDLTKAFPSALAFLIDDHADNRYAFEYGMAYLLLYKDLNAFMHYMEIRKQKGMRLPRLYQEAICLYYAAVQRNPEAFKSYAIDKEVHGKFLQFLQGANAMSPEMLKQQFGDTYYYYAQFVPTPKR